MQMFFENTEQYAGNFAANQRKQLLVPLDCYKPHLLFYGRTWQCQSDMTNLTENLVDAFKAVVENIVPVLEISWRLYNSDRCNLAAVADLLPMLLELVTKNICTGTGKRF